MIKITEDLVAAFTAGWHAADDAGKVGHRVEAGLERVMPLIEMALEAKGETIVRRAIAISATSDPYISPEEAVDLVLKTTDVWFQLKMAESELNILRMRGVLDRQGDYLDSSGLKKMLPEDESENKS